VENGHADAIKVIVAVGAFVETQDDEKATPLHWAAVNGNAEAIKALVAAG
jgi:ankyrin repeat protein